MNRHIVSRLKSAICWMTRIEARAVPHGNDGSRVECPWRVNTVTPDRIPRAEGGFWAESVPPNRIR